MSSVLQNNQPSDNTFLSESDELLSNLENVIELATLDYILQHLTEEQALIFVNLLEKDETGAAAIQYAREHIVDFDTVVTHAIKKELQK